MRVVRLFLLSTLAVLGGCFPYVDTHWDAVPTDQHNLPSDSDDKLKVGDRVLARHRESGKTYAFTIDTLTATGFIGTGKDKKQYPVAFKDLSLLQVERRRVGVINSRGFAHL